MKEKRRSKNAQRGKVLGNIDKIREIFGEEGGKATQNVRYKISDSIS